MLKGIFSVVTPLACMLSVAFAPVGVSADHYNNYNAQACCAPVCEEQPCCNNNRGWFRDAAIFVGAAAVGAIAGVAAGNASGKRGRTGSIGATGQTGFPGFNGAPGLGFILAVVPPGQPNAGAPVTSLVFTFETLAAISAAGGAFQAFVTTPDGRTFLGTTFTGLLGSTATVTIASGPFLAGNYIVGIIAPAGTISLAGLVTAEVSNINGVPTSPPLDQVGIVVAAGVLTDETFFDTVYPFPDVP